MKQFFLSLLLPVFFCGMAAAADYYLSPNGNDSNDGLSLEKAWKSPNKAFQTLAAGDVLWVKGGTYTVTEPVKTKNAGSSSRPIRVYAVRGEKPVFDCSSYRAYGGENAGKRGVELRQAWWHVRGIKVYMSGNSGILIAGENIVVEGCVVEECGHDGFSIASGAREVLVLNCDSYRNANTDSNGENGDGFAAKEGTGIVFRGCRAWENCDDGWDVYGGNQAVLIDSCWAFGNGVNYWPQYISSFQGDGNGFKLGGGGGVDGNAPNVVLHSFAFNNVAKGFDQNHNAWGVTVIHSTGYNNRGMGNFAFQDTPSRGKHLMVNNLSYAGTGQNIAAGSTETANSWNLGLQLSDEMFEALPAADNANAKYDRDDDYRLTDPRLTALFTLKESHPAIDRGVVQTYIRLKPYYAVPYCGSAPDLGARESVAGEWVFPDPDETDPGSGPGTDPEEPGDRPAGVRTVIVEATSSFTVNAGGSSQVWGPFALASAESAVFDMQSTGSSNGTIVVEFSRNGTDWVGVGGQAKNGNTSWGNGKVIDLDEDSAPWGPEIRIRLNNTSNRNVNVRNLKITGSLYDPGKPTRVVFPVGENTKVTGIRYYNLNGAVVPPDTRGVLIKRTAYADGKYRTELCITP
ncbi:MAG: right-handed parallel beta-helix repeat-containing protein [Dysgonamonadaceae bacterium]|nr:right-handed parallel beta-helix repeat-containing protein [Dysgonamonadaceae bacterium]